MIYVVMICDRHEDPDPHLYADLEAALSAAASAAADIGCAVLTPLPAAWLFAAVHEEGDSVYVVQREVIS